MRSANRGFIFLKRILASAREILQSKAQRKPEISPEGLENKAEPPHSAGSTASKSVPGKSKKIYVVWDALGDGRVLGVFSDHELVKRIHQINPHYFRYYECELNRPLPMAVEWLDHKAQKQLQSICTPEGQ